MNDRIRLSWRREETPAELHPLLETLGEEYLLAEGGRGLKLRFRRIDPGKDGAVVSRVVRSRGEALVEYSAVAAAARGIGTALAGHAGTSETPFRSLGIMLDVSRNMVMKVDHLKMWLRRLALSGCSLLMLYSEDTYEIEDEPFFGYLRGAYTLEELREIDDYAAKLGIETVACIQMLGHLEQILKWNAFSPVRDSARVLLVGEEKTYGLIRKMLGFWSSALRSRRIHIGFDETHDLGRGVYMDRGGREEAAVLFNRHLARVCELCAESGYSDPMIWSDMYFRMGSPSREYYDLGAEIPPSVIDMIPEKVRLVYWDYYHTDPADYRRMIARHRGIGREPVMASGIWTWRRFWYDHEKTMRTVVPCLEACRAEKIRELFFTMWGDDGAFCNYDSALAGIVTACDLAYGEEDLDRTAARFEAVASADYDVQIAAGEIEPWIRDREGRETELSAAALIWDDPLLGAVFEDCRRMDPEFDLKLLDHYEELLCRITPALEEHAAGDVEHAVNILQLMVKKLELRGALRAAYDNGDRLALRDIAVNMIPAVIAAVWEFDSSFRKQWMDCSKPFGLEVIQQRNATLAARLEECALRIREYLEGAIDLIDELEVRLPPSAPVQGGSFWLYRKTFSACTPMI